MPISIRARQICWIYCCDQKLLDCAYVIAKRVNYFTCHSCNNRRYTIKQQLIWSSRKSSLHSSAKQRSNVAETNIFRKARSATGKLIAALLFIIVLSGFCAKVYLIYQITLHINSERWSKFNLDKTVPIFIASFWFNWTNQVHMINSYIKRSHSGYI